MYRSEYDARLEDLKAGIADLEEEADLDGIEEDEVDEIENLVPGISDKPVEERYKRQSINWGYIAVHPSDLFAVYKDLATARREFISVTRGGESTRTTAIAMVLAARDALSSNGYTPAEVSAILVSVVANGV